MEEAPEYVQNMFVTEKRHSFDNKGNNNGDSFMVEDLLDFSNDNDDAVIADGCGVAASTDTFTGNSTDSSTVTVIDTSSNSSSGEPANFAADCGTRNFNEVPFSSDLCVPYDDLAELEWQLSSFSEESFSTEDLQKLQLISGIKPRPDDDASHPRQFQPDSNNNNPIFNSDISVPAKARSKRSRAAPCNWTSRLLLLSPTSESSPESSDAAFVSEQQPPPQLMPPASVGKKTLKASPKKKENLEGGASGGDGRKCLHCATDKTPQWRTGPMGPKTLCNACGVRYKSGRLVPEYRPAASPTFVLTKHSNSHRKVLELRRQKEMGRGVPNHHQYIHHHHHQPPQHHHHHHHNPNMIFDVNGGDYLIHQHVGTDFRQLI